MLLEERVALLEKSSRRWRWLAISLTLMIVAGLLVAAEKNAPVIDVLKVRELDVINKDGKNIVIITELHGGGAVTTADSHGNMMASLSSADAGGAVSVISKDEKEQATLESDDAHAHIVVLHDTKALFSEPPIQHKSQ